MRITEIELIEITLKVFLPAMLISFGKNRCLLGAKVKSKNIVFRSKTYRSLKKLASEYEANYPNLARRYRLGWTLEQALGLALPPDRKAHNATQLLSSSGSFSSIRDASKKLRINEQTIAARLRAGWSVDEAIGLALPSERKPRSGVTVLCAGEEFPSVSALARHYKKNDIRTRKRLNSGGSPEQAVDLTPAPPRYREQSGAARDHAWTGKTISEEGHTVPSTVSGS